MKALDIETEIRVGVCAEKDGKYWGDPWQDGNASGRLFSTLTKADISNPEFCKRPESMVWEGLRDVMKGAKLMKITRVITTYVEEIPQ